jgi:hypothetical protein
MTVPITNHPNARQVWHPLRAPSIAEIGTDMGRFPTAGHLLAWAGMCPGQNESAGKRRSSRLRKGSPLLKIVLGPSIMPAIVEKLLDPDNFFALQLYDALRPRDSLIV